MSQSELSRRTGIATSTISDWRKKKINPQADKLVTICKALEMSLIELLCDEKDRENEDYNIQKNVCIITDAEGKRIAVINDLRFKGRKNVDWKIVENCLKDYIGKCTQILDTKEMVYNR